VVTVGLTSLHVVVLFVVKPWLIFTRDVFACLNILHCLLKCVDMCVLKCILFVFHVDYIGSLQQFQIHKGQVSGRAPGEGQTCASRETQTPPDSRRGPLWSDNHELFSCGNHEFSCGNQDP